MVEAILQEAGYRTGLTISPHLQNVNERIRINGCPISDKQLDAVLSKVDALAKHWGESHLNLESGELPLTYFEAVLAAAFLHFKDENVGVEIVEVGLGGRLDATSVVQPTVSAVVSIGLDHTDKLGPDIASVAFEKAGIFRGGVPAVTGLMDPAALRVLRDTAASRGTPLVVYGEDYSVTSGPEGLTWRMGAAEIRNASVSLHGAFQIRNAGVALTIVELLERSGEFVIPQESRRRGLARVEHAGRLEWLSETLLVDGAHNVDSAQVLAEYLESLPHDRPRTLLLGFGEDKDVREIAGALAPQVDQVFTTRCAHPRAASSASIAEALAHLDVPVCEAGPVEKALPRAMTEEGLLVVAGSLYLAGAVRDLLGRP
jgi:dihydrofolate synthase/folylpolyglutamate synthase